MTSVFLSNKLEILAQNLSEKLFDSKLHPLRRKYILVPSPRIKEYLLRCFLENPHVHIAAGVDIYSLEGGVRELIHLSSGSTPKQIPSFLELSLAIEQLLNLCSSREELQSIQSYINQHPKKRIALSNHLAQLFIRYGIYGDQMLATWEGWQSFLWNELQTFGWSYVCEMLKTNIDIDFTVHLFAFSYLPRSYIDFFKRLDSQFYLLSPCSLFWEDLCTDRQRIALEKSLEKQGIPVQQIDALDGYLRAHHPLLANWGILGRKFLSALNIEELIADEDYQQNGYTLLGTLQNDLLTLPEEKQFPLDRSIQIHSAKAALHEVKILHETLCKQMAESTVAPDEILVLAPDIGVYAPFIHFVFGHAVSPLPYKITDLNASSQSLFLTAFADLLVVAKERFELLGIFKLFAHENFCAPIHVSLEETTLLRKWLLRTEVRWGLDNAQREELLPGIEAQGSWEQGIDRLIWGLVMLNPSDAPFSWPLAGVDINQVAILDKLSRLLRSMREDLKPIHDGRTMTLVAWTELFKKLATTYFSMDSEQEAFLTQLNHLRKRLKHMEDGIYAFESVERILLHFFSQKTAVFYSSSGQTIRFSSLHSGSITPAKIVYLLGMDEEGFPRRQQDSSLCELSKAGVDCGAENQADEDKALFLEAILAARIQLIISYCSVNSQDNEPQSPSLIVQELLTYLGYEQELTTHHLPKIEWCERVTPSEGKNIVSSLPNTIDVKDLLHCAKHPIQFFCNKTLGIFLRGDKKLQEDKEFVLSALDRASFRKASRENSLENLIISAQRLGKLPLGSFKKTAQLNISEEIQETAENFKAFDIDPGECFSIELRTDCKSTFLVAPRVYHVPAPHIVLDEERTIALTGKLSDLSPKGLIVQARDKLEDLVKIWPLCLVYLSLSNGNFPWAPQFLFAKDGTIKTAPLGSPFEFLSQYISYHALALQNVSPLMPNWSVPLLRGNCAEFEKKVATTVDGSFASYEDEYVKWFYLREPAPSPKAAFEMWSDQIRPVFAPLVAWEAR